MRNDIGEWNDDTVYRPHPLLTQLIVYEVIVRVIEREYSYKVVWEASMNSLMAHTYVYIKQFQEHNQLRGVTVTFL